MRCLLVVALLFAACGHPPPPTAKPAHAAAAAAPAQARPIVAVFDIEPQGLGWPRAEVGTLSEFLAVHLVESGSFKVVPRAELRKRLAVAKQESYKDCYDQHCQIEIGRELAAQKTLAARVLRVGSQCVLTISLFDLRTATAELAAHAHGGCNVASVAAMIPRVVTALAGGPDQDGDGASDPQSSEETADGRPRLGTRTIKIDCSDCIVDDDSNSRWREFKRQTDSKINYRTTPPVRSRSR
jgi:hypothetical protein